MRDDEPNIDEILNATLRTTPPDEMESAGLRVLERLQQQEYSVARPGWTPGRRTVYALTALGLTAAMVLAFILFRVDRRHDNPAGTRDSANPTGEVSEQVASSSKVPAQAENHSPFSLPDGSRVEAQSGSAWTVESAPDGTLMRLSRGSIIVNATPQRQGHLYVQTRDLRVSASGSVFFVSAEDNGSRAGVIEGIVEVDDGHSPRRLVPGKQFATGSQRTYASIEDGFAWSQNASAHAVLLAASLQRGVPSAGGQAGASSPSTTFVVASVRSSNPTSPKPPMVGRDGKDLFPKCGNGQELKLTPGRYVATNHTLYTLALVAYGVGHSCTVLDDITFLSGGPAWVTTERFDVQATIPPGVPSYTEEQLGNGEAPELQAMLQNLLAERFKLVVRRSPKEMRVYTISNLPEGLRLAASRADQPKSRNLIMLPDQNNELLVHLAGNKMSMTELARDLELATHTPVLDKTGFNGDFSLDIRFAVLDPLSSIGVAIEQAWRRSAATKPTAISVFQELGLKLEAGKSLVDTWVIERAEKPTSN